MRTRNIKSSAKGVKLATPFAMFIYLFMKNLERVPGYGATWASHHLKLYQDRKYIVGDEEQIGSLNHTLNLHPTVCYGMKQFKTNV